MPVGYSLNIGLNSVNPIHYQGWSGVLNACEADAEDMSAISKAKGFKTKTLLTKAATKARVTDEILKHAGGRQNPHFLGQLSQRIGRETGLLPGHHAVQKRQPQLEYKRCQVSLHAARRSAAHLPREQGCV